LQTAVELLDSGVGKVSAPDFVLTIGTVKGCVKFSWWCPIVAQLFGAFFEIACFSKSN
jgi:hypothetical protein